MFLYYGDLEIARYFNLITNDFDMVIQDIAG